MTIVSEATVTAKILNVLQDAGTAIWSTADVRQGIDDALIELSEYRPRLAQATVAFASTLHELSISSLTDLMDIDTVEFPINCHPKRYINFSVRGGTIVLDDYLPSVSTSDTAYIWYTTQHVLDSTTTNTLTAREQSTFVELAAGYSAISKAAKLYAQANSAIATIASAGTAVAAMSTLIANASTALLSGGTAVALIPPLILSAGTALAKVDAQVGLATAALGSGSAYINTIPVDLSPQADWVNYAQTDLANARGYLSEVSGYLSQASGDEKVNDAYGALAMRDLNTAAQYLNQAGGYFHQASAQFSVTSAGKILEDWGQRKRTSAINKLKGLVTPNFAVRYPDVK
jgi:hypothetical protein